MASKNTSSNSRQAVQRSNSDSARWIAGLLLLFIGLFAAAAVFFSFFSWAADQSGLQKSVEERVTLGIEPENLCGWAGARLGMLLVDHSFGLFGILIPAMIVLVGVRIVRQRPFDPFAVSDYDPGVADAGIRLRQPLEPLLLDGVGRRFRHRLFGPAAHAYRGFRNADPACRRLDTDGCFHQPQLHQQGQRGGQRGGRQEREGRRDPQAQSRAARTCGRGGRGCGGYSRTGSETRAEGGRTAARAVESGGTRGAKTRPDPCGTSVGARCGSEVRAGRGRKSLPRTDARRETRRRGDCRGADAPSRGGRGVHRGGPFASRGPCGDRPQRAGRAGTPCGARRRRRFRRERPHSPIPMRPLPRSPCWTTRPPRSRRASW